MYCISLTQMNNQYWKHQIIQDPVITLGVYHNENYSTKNSNLVLQRHAYTHHHLNWIAFFAWNESWIIQEWWWSYFNSMRIIQTCVQNTLHNLCHFMKTFLMNFLIFSQIVWIQKMQERFEYKYLCYLYIKTFNLFNVEIFTLNHSILPLFIFRDNIYEYSWTWIIEGFQYHLLFLERSYKYIEYIKFVRDRIKQHETAVWLIPANQASMEMNHKNLQIF